MPDDTLKAFADHGKIGALMPPDGGDCERVLDRFDEPGVNLDELAARLQDEGTKSFSKSWDELMTVIAKKSESIKQAARPGD